MTEASDLLAAAEGASDGARAAWGVACAAALPDGWTRTLQANGFIDNDLRFRHGEDWMFSAVLNDDWVLFYARRPAINAGLIDADAMLDRFPAARLTKRREVAIRLADADAAQAVLAWCLG